MQPPPSRAAHIALCALLALSIVACRSGLRCGAGTHEVAGECRPDPADVITPTDGATSPDGSDAAVDTVSSDSPRDAPATDAPAPLDGYFPPMDASVDAPASDALVPNEFIGISLEALDGPYGGPIQTVGIGIPTTFAVWGDYLDGTSRLITEGVQFSVLPADSPVALFVHDGLARVTPSGAADFQLVANATSASGIPLNDSIRVLTANVTDATLSAVAVQDGAWFGPEAVWDAPFQNIAASADGSSTTLLPATAPAGGAVRVVSMLRYSLDAHYPDGSMQTLAARSVLDAASVGYHFGAGTMDTAGLLRSDVPATTDISVEYTPPGASAPLTSTAHAQFVSPSPARGLLFTEGEPLAHFSPATPLPVQTSAEGTLSLASFTDGTVALSDLASVRFIGTDAGKTATVDIVAVHGSDSGEYFEWLPYSTVALDVVSGAETFSVDSTGTFTMGTAGVGAWIVHADGFDLAGLTISPYASSTAATLRIAPSTLAITAPASPGSPPTCASVQAYVTPAGGTERALTSVENLAVVRMLLPGSGGVPLDPAHTSPFDFCVDYFGLTPMSATFDFYFLSLQTQVTLDATPAM